MLYDGMTAVVQHGEISSTRGSASHGLAIGSRRQKLTLPKLIAVYELRRRVGVERESFVAVGVGLRGEVVEIANWPNLRF